MKEKKEYRNLKEEALDRAVWRTHCARSYGHLAKQKDSEMRSQRKCRRDVKFDYS